MFFVKSDIKGSSYYALTLILIYNESTNNPPTEEIIKEQVTQFNKNSLESLIKKINESFPGIVITQNVTNILNNIQFTGKISRNYISLM